MNSTSLTNIAGYKELIALIGRSSAGIQQAVVMNNTGSSIFAGSAVYMSGSNGILPTVSLAKADTLAKVLNIGFVVNDIPTGEADLIQFAGVISAVDTSAFATGDYLYVSAATAGLLTNTPPAAPNFSRRVALVILASTAGSIFLFPDDTVQGGGIGVATGTSLALSGGLGVYGKAVPAQAITGSALVAYSAGVNGLATAGAMADLVAKVAAIDAALNNIGFTST